MKKPTTGGRPPKFREKRRPITVTLPERVLQTLETVNWDRARAIVKCVEAVSGAQSRFGKAVEIVEVLPHKALIIVGPSQLLSTLEGVRLVEVAPTRHLIILSPGTPVERVEIQLADLMEDLTPEQEAERPLLQELRALINRHRRRKSVSKAELLFVDIP